MLLFIFLFILCIPHAANAYIDPVTGSIVLQAIVGAIATALFFIKLYWKKLKRFFAKMMGKEVPDEDEDEIADIKKEKADEETPETQPDAPTIKETAKNEEAS